MVTASSPVLAVHAAHLLSDAFFCSILYIVSLLFLLNRKKTHTHSLSLCSRFRLCLYRPFSYYPGGCINASPAGKRRIAAGAEQQIGDDISVVLNGIGGKSSGGDASETNGVFVRFTSTTTAITSIAIAVCALIVTLFVIIFAVLQVNING